MIYVSESFWKTGLARFVKENQNMRFEWLHNFGNTHDAVLDRNTFKKQLEVAYRQTHSVQKEVYTKDGIQNWLVSYLSKFLLIDISEVNIYLPFEYYGITSLEALRFIHAIEVWLDRQVSLNLVYEYPTVEVLAQHLAKELECAC